MKKRIKIWIHNDYPGARYDGDYCLHRGVRKFRLELVHWVDKGQDLPPQRRYFKSWQDAVKKGWIR